MTPLDSFPQQHKQLSALAFDYGTQRIGVAYGQSLTGTAQAVAVIRARDGVPDWKLSRGVIVILGVKSRS